MSEKSRLYKDFDPNKTPNTIWTFETDDDGNNTFEEVVCSHAISGDTDSCYCKFPNNFTSVASEDELVKAADIIASRVNDAYPSFLERAFNCPSSRNDSMVSEREIVSDATLIVTKKRYAMHVINDEGKKVDKLKIMGLEIKKADTSPIVKEILYDMVKRILAGQSRHQLKQSIEDFKQRFFESDPHDIALPCGCKTLVKAQKQLRETGSLKGIHYVSKAAVFYNSKCGPKDAKVRAGDKVGLLYIKHGESKYIGFPRDATMLPEWLDDIVVDYDTMWKKAETKITNYLKSMGWDIATINKQRRNDMFGF